MTDSPSTPKQSPWYRWAGEWRRDEKFWREIATRTIATLLALFITSVVAYVSLLVTGFLAQPNAWVSIIIGIVVVVMSLFWFGLVWALVYSFIDKESASMRPAFIVGVIVVGAALTWIVYGLFHP